MSPIHPFIMLPILILLLGISAVKGAGVAIHGTVVSRIHGLLPIDIQNEDLLPYLAAGSFFPDAFYSCSTWNNASEDAHWPPFLQSAVQYHNELEDSGGADPKELLQFKAFLYGVFAHQITDSSWHSLRMKQGLMKMLAAIEFDGSYSDVHRYLDTAGDFLQLMKVADTSFYLNGWELPNLEFIKTVFKRRGFVISDFDITQCTQLGNSALLGEISVRDPTGKVMLQQSPLAGLLLEDYFLGGLRDITWSLGECLPHLNKWFEGELKEDPYELCGAIKHRSEPAKNSSSTSSTSSTSTASSKSTALVSTPKATSSSVSISTSRNDELVIVSPYLALSQFGHALSLGEFLNEPSIAISSVEEGGSVYILPIAEYLQQKSTAESSTRVLKIKSSTVEPTEDISSEKVFKYNPNFGQTLHKIKLFNNEFLMISEPGLSLLHLFYQNDKILTIYSSQTSTDYGRGKHKEQFTVIETIPSENRFKPYEDIIIASPFDDSQDNHPQRGIVRVLSGAIIEQLISSGVKRVEINQVTINRIFLNDKFKQHNGYEQFGSAVATDQTNIYIASRGIGGVIFVHDAHTFQLRQIINQTQITNVEELTSSSYSRIPSKESKLFGESIHTFSFNGVQYVIVSSTAYGSSMTGGLYLYVVSANGHLALEGIITLGSVFNWFLDTAQFGYSVAVDEINAVLYIGAPGYKDHGGIFKVNLKTVIREDSIGSRHIKDGKLLKLINGIYGGQAVLNPSHVDSQAPLIHYVSTKDIILEGSGYKKAKGKGFTGLGQSIELTGNVLVYTEEYFGFDEFFDDKLKLVGRVGLLKL